MIQKLKNLYFSGLPLLIKIREKLKDRTKKYSTPFGKMRREFYNHLWQETAKELGAEIKEAGYGYWAVSLNSATTYVIDSEVMLDNYLIRRMAGNKPLIHKILAENNYPVVDFLEYDLSNLKIAYQYLERLGRPVVVKPARSGAAGKGITTGITTKKSLKPASLLAATFGPKLILEELVEGQSYRLLYLEGKFLDAVRRNPPQVTGDGKSSIKQLIETENLKRLQGETIISLHPLSVDLELKYFLKSLNYRLTSILPARETIPVKRVVNQNSLHENESVRKIVHPSIIETGSQISRLLGIELAGLDIMTSDITKPLDQAGGIINEVNISPGLHHHYLISKKEEIVPVAKHVLKYILKIKSDPSNKLKT